MGMLMMILGGFWAFLGGGNIFGMPYDQMSSVQTVLGLMFNMLLFVFPGLGIYAMGSRMRNKSTNKRKD